MTRTSGGRCTALRSLAWAALMVSLLAAGVPAAADPMRPLVLPSASAGASASASAGAGAMAAQPAAAPAPAAARLLAIRHDGAQRWQALFGERWLARGERLDAQTVVAAIDANSVQLAQGKHRRTLHLLPPLTATSSPNPSSPLSPSTP